MQCIMGIDHNPLATEIMLYEHAKGALTFPEFSQFEWNPCSFRQVRPQQSHYGVD